MNHNRLTLAAIDDMISRGKLRDWLLLRDATLGRPEIREKVLRVCQAYVDDPYEQRYHAWKNFVEFIKVSAKPKGNVMGKARKKKASQDWKQLLMSAAKLQQILPEAVLVGGTAAAIHAGHRISVDADHVLTDLKRRFDQVLRELESIAGWKTARVRRPVLILGNLDGIETGVRQLIRTKPLETEEVEVLPGLKVRLPTAEEMLRIKAVLILKRNATRDYIDFAALADLLGPSGGSVSALEPFDELYPQQSGESATQQLIAQLSSPMPYDLEEIDLSEYKNLDPKWCRWDAVRTVCQEVANALLLALEHEKGTEPGPSPGLQ